MSTCIHILPTERRTWYAIQQFKPKPRPPHDDHDNNRTNEATEQPNDNPWNQPTATQPSTNVNSPPSQETCIPTTIPSTQRSIQQSSINLQGDLPNTPSQPYTSQKHTTDSQTSSPRSHRTIETNTINTNDDDPNNQYIPRETIERRLDQLFQNLDNIQLGVSQESLPSYNRRLEDAQNELRIIETGLGRTKQNTIMIEAARTHLINATNYFTTITLKYSNNLNLTILPVIQQLLESRITQCQDDFQLFQNDLVLVNQCIQQLQ